MQVSLAKHATDFSPWFLTFDFKSTNTFVQKEKQLRGEDFNYDWTCHTEYAPFVIIDISIELLENKQQFKERHIERGYTLNEVKSIIAQTEFEIVDWFVDCEKKEPSDTSDLIQVVIKKKLNKK